MKSLQSANPWHLLGHVLSAVDAHSAELNAVGTWLFDLHDCYTRSTVNERALVQKSPSTYSGWEMTAPFSTFQRVSVPSMLDSNLVGNVFKT